MDLGKWGFGARFFWGLGFGSGRDSVWGCTVAALGDAECLSSRYYIEMS